MLLPLQTRAKNRLDSLLFANSKLVASRVPTGLAASATSEPTVSNTGKRSAKRAKRSTGVKEENHDVDAMECDVPPEDPPAKQDLNGDASTAEPAPWLDDPDEDKDEGEMRGRGKQSRRLSTAEQKERAKKWAEEQQEINKRLTGKTKGKGGKGPRKSVASNNELLLAAKEAARRAIQENAEARANELLRTSTSATTAANSSKRKGDDAEDQTISRMSKKPRKSRG